MRVKGARAVGEFRSGLERWAHEMLDDPMWCEAAKRCVRRFLFDLGRTDIVFDWPQARSACMFSRLLVHWKGACAGKAYRPEVWQDFVKANLYGWHRTCGRRRFRYGYLEIPRKNGKSFMGADFALTGLVWDREEGPEVYSLATKEDQAKYVWETARRIVQKSSILGDRCSLRQKEILSGENNGLFKPLGSDSKTLDGLSPSTVICDELHQWPTRDLWDVIDDAQGSRENPLICAITTAGDSADSFCKQQHDIAVATIDEQDARNNDSLFVFVTTVNEGDQWEDEDAWRRSNPNLGVSKYWDFMREQADIARMEPNKLPAFLTKQLNIWCGGSNAGTWLDRAAWREGEEQFSEAALAGRPYFSALDLATKLDITALVDCYPPVDADDLNYYFIPRFYIPETRADPTNRDNKRQGREVAGLIKQWADAGYFTVTPGNATDYNFIKRELLNRKHKPELVVYDPYNATHLAIELFTEGGILVNEFKQSIGNYTEGSKEFEKLIVQRRARHQPNPVFDWMVSNVIVHEDARGNIMPHKGRSAEKIDGVVCAIMALSAAMRRREEPKKICGVFLV